VAGITSTKEGRREYHRRYYQRNKEKAKDYQRNYSKKKKNSTTQGRGDNKIRNTVPFTREIKKSSYSGHSLQHLSVEEFVKVVNAILNFEVVYTGV